MYKDHLLLSILLESDDEVDLSELDDIISELDDIKLDIEDEPEDELNYEADSYDKLSNTDTDNLSNQVDGMDTYDSNINKSEPDKTLNLNIDSDKNINVKIPEEKEINISLDPEAPSSSEKEIPIKLQTKSELEKEIEIKLRSSFDNSKILSDSGYKSKAKTYYKTDEPKEVLEAALRMLQDSDSSLNKLLNFLPKNEMLNKTKNTIQELLSSITDNYADIIEDETKVYKISVNIYDVVKSLLHYINKNRASIIESVKNNDV